MNIWGHSEKAAICKTGREVSKETKPANTLILDFSELEKTYFWWIGHYVCGTFYDSPSKVMHQGSSCMYLFCYKKVQHYTSLWIIKKQVTNKKPNLVLKIFSEDHAECLISPSFLYTSSMW